MDSWLKIQGLKQKKLKRPILFYTAYFGNVELESNSSIALLKHKWKDQPEVTFRSVR